MITEALEEDFLRFLCCWLFFSRFNRMSIILEINVVFIKTIFFFRFFFVLVTFLVSVLGCDGVLDMWENSEIFTFNTL